jgi:polyhydroxybutyrate depolymerase
MLAPFFYRVAVGAATLLLVTASAGADVIRVATPQGAREAIVIPGEHASAPTVIVLHGAMMTAALTARSSGFAEAAAARGFASVFPQGINRQWNDGREGRVSWIDDVGFLRGLVDELVRRRISDPARIYIAGISNGGMMTFRMLCEAPELFAGAATIIANMPAGIGDRCTRHKPMPVIMFNGTADPLVPFHGGGVGFLGGRGIVWSTEKTAEFLVRIDECDPRAASRSVDSSDELVRVTRLEWSRCRTGQHVGVYIFEGGGHQMPGRTAFLPGLLGLGSRQVAAAETALVFLTH